MCERFLDTELTRRAMQFQVSAHNFINQKRKYTDEPYWTHPRAVAAIVSRYLADENVVAAALLHDVVEDTPIPHSEILRSFGVAVSNLVREVTDVSKPEDGPRAVRKALDRDHLAMASPAGMTIKLADLLHNTSSICQYDKNFARVYLPEKRDLMAVLDRGHPDLYQRCWQSLDVNWRAVFVEPLTTA